MFLLGFMKNVTENLLGDDDGKMLISGAPSKRKKYAQKPHVNTQPATVEILFGQVDDAPNRGGKNYTIFKNFKIKIELESE
jgi:hypothetical protein